MTAYRSAIAGSRKTLGFKQPIEAWRIDYTNQKGVEAEPPGSAGAGLDPWSPRLTRRVFIVRVYWVLLKGLTIKFYKAGNGQHGKVPNPQCYTQTTGNPLLERQVGNDLLIGVKHGTVIKPSLMVQDTQDMQVSRCSCGDIPQTVIVCGE